MEPHLLFQFAVEAISPQVEEQPAPELRKLVEQERYHSDRSTVIGSTFVARRAGIQHASRATNASSNVITIKVSGSVALTPNSRVFIKRVAMSAPPRPIPTPANTRPMP